MSKSIPDAVLDTFLDEIATGTRVDVTSDVGTPTDLSNTLANVTVAAGDGGGDWTIANGDTSGRKLTLTQQADVSITGTGTALHIVISLASVILAITTCTSQALTSGGTVTIPAFDIEIADPT